MKTTLPPRWYTRRPTPAHLAVILGCAASAAAAIGTTYTISRHRARKKPAPRAVAAPGTAAAAGAVMPADEEPARWYVLATATCRRCGRAIERRLPHVAPWGTPAWIHAANTATGTDHQPTHLAVPVVPAPLVDLLTTCWELEKHDGGWPGADVVDAVTDLLTRTWGLDITHPAMRDTGSGDHENYDHADLAHAAAGHPPAEAQRLAQINMAAVYYPPNCDPDTEALPAVKVGGVMVFTYLHPDGTLRVSVDLDETDPTAFPSMDSAEGCVPITITVNGILVWTADATGAERCVHELDHDTE